MTEQIVKKLKQGNEAYVLSGAYQGDVSAAARSKTENGQKPYAVIITCSDSRVIPEAVFGAGNGELFVIRVAGNVVGENELASVEYAVCHLGVKVVVVMGHTHCGAVHAALHGEFGGLTGHITRKISGTVGEERDEAAACLMNVAAGVKTINENVKAEGLRVFGAVYDIVSGKVTFR